MMNTGLLDKHGHEIKEGDRVSLDGNMTADDSMGGLPNGWIFDETDVCEVYFDDRIAKWALKIKTDMSSLYEVKFLNHAMSLLHSGAVEIVQ